MYSKNSSVSNSTGSLQHINKREVSVKLEPNEKWPQSRRVDDVKQRKTGHAAFLKRVPPHLDLYQQSSGDGKNLQAPQRKISEPIKSSRKISDTILQRKISQGQRRPDPDIRSYPWHGDQHPPVPISSSLRHASEISRGQMHQTYETTAGYHKGSTVSTGWDIHGRRETFQPWPSDDRKLTQLIHRPSFLSQLLQGRFKDDKSGSLRSSDRHPIRPRIQLENTYKMKPDEQFEVDVVQKIIKNVLENYLEHQEYDGLLMGQKTRTLADMIKEKVKSLRYDRYKIISWVVIGQKGCNDVRIASKGLWDKHNDTYADAVYENRSLYAMGVCYGIYQE